MDSQKKFRKTVIVSPKATDDLDAVWQWNEGRCASGHANAYVANLERAIQGLARHHDKGGFVGPGSGLRFMLVRRRMRGHGHVLVYRLDDRNVYALRVFHTAQDWRAEMLGNGET